MRRTPRGSGLTWAGRSDRIGSRCHGSSVLRQGPEATVPENRRYDLRATGTRRLASVVDKGPSGPF